MSRSRGSQRDGGGGRGVAMASTTVMSSQLLIVAIMTTQECSVLVKYSTVVNLVQFDEMFYVCVALETKRYKAVESSRVKCC